MNNINEGSNSLDKLTNKIKNINLNDDNNFNENKLFQKIKNNDINNTYLLIEYILNEFGTKEPCNRFDVGNSIEYAIGDYLRSFNYNIKNLPNSKRIDLLIDEIFKISIKYSSTGDITLHNSNSQINKDMHFTDLLLITTDDLYLIKVIL